MPDLIDRTTLAQMKDGPAVVRDDLKS